MTQHEGLGPELVKRRPDITMEMVDKFLTKMYRANPDFVWTVDTRFRAQLPNARTNPAGLISRRIVRCCHGVRACSRRRGK